MTDTDSHFPVETDADHDTKLDTKVQVEKVPHRGPVGDTKENEKARHKVAQKRKFLDACVGEQQGWQSLPQSLIEAAKKVMKAPKTPVTPDPKKPILTAKVKDESAPPFKSQGEHPFMEPKKEKPNGR